QVLGSEAANELRGLGTRFDFRRTCMAISSVTSSETAQLAATYAKSQAERIERVENDGDSDDKKAEAAQPAKEPTSTVNASGQTIGSVVNTKA
ncbi:MAG: hypothetical protein J0I46_12105, partial [Thiobacillus sp.]|nr:hypothetical protein [Thiobacillus sp.]